MRFPHCLPQREMPGIEDDSEPEATALDLPTPIHPPSSDGSRAPLPSP